MAERDAKKVARAEDYAACLTTAAKGAIRHGSGCPVKSARGLCLMGLATEFFTRPGSKTAHGLKLTPLGLAVRDHLRGEQ